MALRILISGASIAGNTLAWWLGRSGHEITVVERAPAFRDGGQNVDVRGVGREVLRRMGLEQEALDHGTGETGTAWIDGEGRIKAQFLTDGMSGDGPTAEMEILRGDLARLLYEPARERATYRFGDSVVSVVDADDSVLVTFSSGRSDRYDVVVVAEGAGSTTRGLVFPGENNARWMNLTMAYFTIPRVPDDDRLWRWYHAPGGCSISLRPDHHGTTRAMLTIRRRARRVQDWSVERQKAWLHERLADAGWQTERVLEGLAGTSDFYFDVLRQVRMPRWSKGRVVLLGDAAWCVTPIGGIGTTLAIVGARVLAGEIERAEDLRAAFAEYEKALRPIVEGAQNVPDFALRFGNPKGSVGIRLLHGFMNAASRPAVRRVASALFGNPPKEPDLSRYDHLPAIRDGGAARSKAKMPRVSHRMRSLVSITALVAASAALIGATSVARRKLAKWSKSVGP